MNRTGTSSPRATPADAAGTSVAQFAADVQYYLMQDPRQLPSRYLYDPLGSALFEAICELPWYNITRAEGRLLGAYGADVFRRIAPVSTIVELGPGSGEKLKTLIEAGHVEPAMLDVHLVDVSASALDLSARTLATLPGVRLAAHEASYEAGLREAAAERDPTNRMLVVFLGSNIGNFDRPGASAFLRGVRAELREGDGLLLGTDLVKPVRDLQLAYDDPLGVTAAFNRNLLVRINRELGGNFVLDEFAHRAVWNEAESRVEMHLVARSAQEIRVDAAGIQFSMAAGDAIWTESSYKYRPGDVARLLEAVGLRPTARWIDQRGAFGLTLAVAI